VRLWKSSCSIAAAAFALLGAAAVAAGQDALPPPEPLRLADTQLEPITWSEVGGWAGEDHRAAFATFLASCQPFLRVKRTTDERAVYKALWLLCRKARSVNPARARDARAFFEENFRPVRINRLGESQGFLTGYYEPVVQGSRFPNPEFHVPLYRRPRDLLAAGHAPGAAGFPNKGVPVGRRDDKGELVPYFDRGEIEAGALDGRGLEICWLRDPFDVLNIQIQGSGRVILEDGTLLRINYDAHNGHPYTAVGRILIERNLVAREEMSMQRIRDWMKANPDEAPKLRATNRSYVFFRITGLGSEREPPGAQGVPLTPGRSIAVDKLHVYGTPFFIAADLPIESARPVTPFRRLMIAQDTGSAIIGPARADLYFGAGDAAGRVAGRIRHPGTFVMLLPRALDMVEAGKLMPLPPPKPAIADAEEAKEPDAAKPAAKPDDKPAEKPADKPDDGAKKKPAKPGRQAVRTRPRP
jgi:membrane-bound lytic murein transglycosylase A